MLNPPFQKKRLQCQEKQNQTWKSILQQRLVLDDLEGQMKKIKDQKEKKRPMMMIEGKGKVESKIEVQKKIDQK